MPETKSLEPGSAGGYANILFERQGPVARITFNRPERRNALTIGLFEDLHAALDVCEQDDGIRVIVLTGAGSAFCAGRDFKESTESTDEQIQYYGRLNLGFRDRLRKLGKPVIARVNGPASGGGCAISTDCCDIAIAGASARFSIREVQAGSIPGLPVFTLGRARTLGMVLTGDWVSAEQAERWGLVYRAVADDELDAAVDAVAEQLASQPAQAMAYTKQATAFLLDLAGYAQTEQFLAECRKVIAGTKERREGQMAFLKKRRR
jgi:2-(1,2-epoxy-1,2-dihydrophenyl)acetyl-CoA isomerase